VLGGIEWGDEVPSKGSVSSLPLPLKLPRASRKRPRNDDHGGVCLELQVSALPGLMQPAEIHEQSFAHSTSMTTAAHLPTLLQDCSQLRGRRTLASTEDPGDISSQRQWTRLRISTAKNCWPICTR
jgi:hypothetical protein